jgi:transcriptional/translational regulatory protein YebC/TACO1
MAGHNKWSIVKCRKGALDQNRGQLFLKLAKENILAVRTRRLSNFDAPEEVLAKISG